MNRYFASYKLTRTRVIVEDATFIRHRQRHRRAGPCHPQQHHLR